MVGTVWLLLVFSLVSDINSAVTQVMYTPASWQFFSSNATCNPDTDVSLGDNMLLVQKGVTSPTSKPKECDLTVKLTDKRSIEAYIEITGNISCGNTIHITGKCAGKHCKETTFTCSSTSPQYNSWEKVEVVSLTYKVTNTSTTDDLKVYISPVYPVSRTERGIVKKLAKGVVIVIVVVVVLVLLCAVGVPALVCCFCKKGGSSSDRDQVRYVNPGSAQPMYPVYPVIQQRGY